MTEIYKEPALVTVIIPTIGRPEFIVDTLRSVIAQSYKDLQILISDNAPTVSTATLLAAENIDDARIEVVQHSHRLDFSVHMNACIAQARGVYLMIVSDDDQIMPDYIEEMVEIMSIDPSIKVCLGRQVQIDETDYGVLTQAGRRRPRQILEGVDFLFGTLTNTLDTGLMTYISMFVRRCDIIQAGGFKSYPDGSHADNLIILNLALSGRVALASSKMFYRVYRESFGLRTAFSALLGATRAYTQDADVVLRKAPISIDQRQTLRRLIKSANTHMLLYRIRTIYRPRLNLLELFVCLIQVVKFRFGR